MARWAKEGARRLKNLTQINSTEGLRGYSKGMSGIEVIIALGILGLAAIVFLSGLSTALKATYLADERSVAQSLARSEMEYVKSQRYCDVAWDYTITSSARSYSSQPCWWGADDPPLLSSEYAGYSVEVGAEDYDADGDGSIEVPGDDEGIRKITVTINHDGEEVLVLGDYKVDR